MRIRAHLRRHLVDVTEYQNELGELRHSNTAEAVLSARDRGFAVFRIGTRYLVAVAMNPHYNGGMMAFVYEEDRWVRLERVR